MPTTCGAYLSAVCSGQVAGTVLQTAAHVKHACNAWGYEVHRLASPSPSPSPSPYTLHPTPYTPTQTEAKSKKDQIIARARTAKASTKVNDMLAGVGSSSSVAAFERMKDKVEQMEAEADVRCS